MKIAVPTRDGRVDDHFGHCAYYTIFNIIDGKISEVNSPYPIPEKFKSFGWNVIEIDAHSFDEIDAAFKAAADFKGKPSVIVANSVKGKGVSFMEDQVSWHGSAPNAEQYEQAMNELTQALAELEA